MLITLSNKTKKTTKTIINLIALCRSRHLHLIKPTSIPFCSSQQLAPEITTNTTSPINTTAGTSPIVPTDIQTPIATNNLNDASNLTSKFSTKELHRL